MTVLESSIRQRLIKEMKSFGAFAVENPVCPGTPDICLILGWIETKVAKRPALVTTDVNVKVRNEQRIWWSRWTRAGGKCWTFTLVERSHTQNVYYLHKASWAIDHLGKSTEQAMRLNAVAFWVGDLPDAKELIPELVK